MWRCKIAEQMSDYLIRGAISNAVNFPSITAEEAPKLKPYIALTDCLGSFAGQLVDSGIKRAVITYEGDVAELKTKGADRIGDRRAFAAAACRRQCGFRAGRGQGAWHRDRRSDPRGRNRFRIADYAFGRNGRPRAARFRARSSTMESLASSRSTGSASTLSMAPLMIYVSNEDKPGFIGRFASILGNAGVNIATFALGRDREGGSAIALVEVDSPVAGQGTRRNRNAPWRQRGQGAGILRLDWRRITGGRNADPIQQLQSAP